MTNGVQSKGFSLQSRYEKFFFQNLEVVLRLLVTLSAASQIQRESTQYNRRIENSFLPPEMTVPHEAWIMEMPWS